MSGAVNRLDFLPPREPTPDDIQRVVEVIAQVIPEGGSTDPADKVMRQLRGRLRREGLAYDRIDDEVCFPELGVNVKFIMGEVITYEVENWTYDEATSPAVQKKKRKSRKRESSRGPKGRLRRKGESDALNLGSFPIESQRDFAQQIIDLLGVPFREKPGDDKWFTYSVSGLQDRGTADSVLSTVIRPRAEELSIDITEVTTFTLGDQLLIGVGPVVAPS